MTNRVVVGKRTNGDLGVFVSPPGLDAKTAIDSQLILGIAQGISQLVMQSQVSSSTTVYLGFSRAPFVFVTSLVPITGVGGAANFSSNGPTRPSPVPSLRDNGDDSYTIVVPPPSYVTINSNGASMSVNAPRKTFLSVYNRAFT